ncbi:unnamed protein product [Somion occarium]|uniref:P-loop containing nucleoside triphosphate hydrolase protein n=1 Tax=Somion occarium TaxID=3059160 RepID=A0ABP1DH68_9APHY
MFDSGQVILENVFRFASVIEDSDWEDILLIPAYIMAISCVILVGQAIYHTFAHSKERALSPVDADDQGVHIANPSHLSRLRAHIDELGGLQLFFFRLIHLLACLALVVLSIATNLQQLTATYTYASCLSLFSLSAKSPWNRIAKNHLHVVLIASFALFAYRDLWPLATYTLTPADGAEGWLLWTEVGVLSFAAVFIPLVSPRQYVPVDPEDGNEPTPEQTASWLSRLFYIYCDPVVLKAFRVPHMKIDDLPLLSDFNRTKYLVKESFQHLDPLLSPSRTHIGLKLTFKVFPVEHVRMALALIAYSGLTMAGPIAINRLLAYLETGGTDEFIQPWFWVLWILFGDTLASIAINYYNYQATTVFVQCQAILTQLIFDHALRIRVKAEVSKPSPTASNDTTAVSTPDTASVAEGEGPSTFSESSAASTASCTASSSTKGKNTGPEADKAKEPIGVEKHNLTGRLNNLVTSDVDSLVNGQQWMMIAFFLPMQLVFNIWFLYILLGWGVLPGFSAMILMSPLPGLIAKLINNTQVQKMKKSDARVQNVTEILNVIRMVKLFGNDFINSALPIVMTLTSYGIYTLVMKQPLTASRIFASVTLFRLLEGNLHMMFMFVPGIIEGKVALDRMNEFIQETELLDKYTSDIQATVPTSQDEVSSVGIGQSSFTWMSEEHACDTTPSSTRPAFTLRIDDEVSFKPGCINLVIGQTGSGKTSLLMALLGEMHRIPTGPHSFLNLPRQGGVAYHAQESWVLNETIRDNILFGAPYDEHRYNTVLEQCALKHDIELFQAGDQTEVGEKGLTLSGGQKARVTLARAVYSSAEILLLDDVLAALDVHTARWIVDKCFQGDLVRGRTVILVTHNVAMMAPVADFVVSLGLNGQILSQGTLSNALAKDETLLAEVDRDAKAIEKAEHDVIEAPPDTDPTTKSGKLIVEEEVSEGHLGWSALKLLVVNMAGKGGTFVFWLSFIGVCVATRASDNMEIWVLTLWASRYEDPDSSDVPIIPYLALYTGVYFFTVLLMVVGSVVWFFGSLRASRRIHELLVKSVLGSSLRWLDRTPVSRIITRCTQDIQQIDSGLPSIINALIDYTASIVLKFTAVLLISPIFIIPGLILIVVGVSIGNVYMKAQLPVKREGSNARAPVLGHFGSAVSGIVSIRAYGAQDAFRKESYRRIDQYTRAQRQFWDLNRWINVRMNLLASLFASSLAAYLTYGTSITASKAGFSLNMAVGFSSMILWWVRFLNMVETRGNSLERIQQYIEIEHEPKSAKEGVPPAYWPASGDLRVENLSARYSPDGPKVLHEISFHIVPGERIGIVGRTGSGKSSLTLALLRAIITEGKMYYDGIATDTLNLDALRSNITIIPQVPELLSGTLRQNLDPLSQHDDAVLNSALCSAGLFSLQNANTESRLALDSQISGGGSNLSVGQRQILALARALVRQSKILILDEATSAIDYETDAVIQKSLRSELGKDVTLLTVAHRLQTIMDSDKIMVLDAGRLVEFDKPTELLKNEKSYFRALIEESGDKEALLAMIN